MEVVDTGSFVESLASEMTVEDWIGDDGGVDDDGDLEEIGVPP